MEKLARALARNIALTLGYDDERQAVIAYGLIAIIQIIVTVSIVLILGILIGTPIEALIVCFSVSILRKYSGGMHAGFAELCTGIGIVYCTVTAFLAKNLFLPLYRPIPMLIAIAAIYGISYWVLWKYAPVDSPNKPIRTEQKRKRMKKYSFGVVSVYLAFSLILFIFGFKMHFLGTYGISFLFGVSWQTLTLTPPGGFLLHSVDKLFGKEVSKL